MSHVDGSGLTIEGSCAITGSASVAPASNPSLQVDGSFTVAGGTTLSGGLTVSGTTTFEDGTTTLGTLSSTGLTINGDTTLNTLYSKYKVAPSISTLTDDVSGTIYTCDITIGDVSITLPDISDSSKVGTHYSFIVKATATTPHGLTINTPNNTVNIYGSETFGQAAGGMLSASTIATIITVKMQNRPGRHLIKLIAIADKEWIVVAGMPQYVSIEYTY